MSAMFFKKVIVPQLQMRRCLLVCISSLSTSDNFFSQLITRKVNGKNAFKVIRIELACERCKKLNIPTQCKHMAGSIPPWQAEGRKEVAHSLLADDEDVERSDQFRLHAVVGRDLLAPREAVGVIGSEVEVAYHACVR